MTETARLAAENEAELFVKRHSSDVFRLAYAVTRNRQDAEDVSQEVFMTCFARPRRFNGAVHEKRWLLRVTVNACRDLLSKRRPEKELKESDAAVTYVPRDGAVSDAVAALPERERECVHLHYYCGYKISEIARISGESAGTVKSRLSRARKKLSEMLGEEIEE